MADHVETLTLPAELAREFQDAWRAHTEAVSQAGDDLWTVAAEGDEALADLYQQMWGHVTGSTVLSKLISDAQSYRRESAREARRSLREQQRCDLRGEA